MALKKTITHNVELLGDQTMVSYIRVKEITGNKSSMTAVFDYLKDKSDGPRIKTGSVDFVPVLDGQNFIAQAYESMKKLAALYGAEDC
jgi:hypothetical protein